ncbi:unnamed protein product [Candidula unifasciata]|uniref:THUMP domain-containing protein n=1 Tax=Candidula unifasciata TaxID=100452 RepID=A0A8S3ZLD6_9EUPU|nr:unnamed protein product [Candidula unifasciata]
MPLELVSMEGGKKILSPGDRGFIMSLSKIRWNKHASVEALKMLKSFAQAYYAEKCPEGEAPVEEGSEGGSVHTNSGGNRTGIQFVHRELMFTTFCFIATNLADPADYAHYIMTQLADSKHLPKTKFPFRIMPVQAVCEARPKAIEKAIIPLIEKILGVDDQPYRFSLLYRGNSEADHLTQQEAKFVVRNCVWAVNPYCVQCLKYQDYAVLLDIVAPLFCFGIAKDYQRLAGYNTWTIRMGLDLAEEKEDSEDEFSDNSTLDDQLERKRKIEFKKRRRAEMAELQNSQQTEGQENQPEESEMPSANEAGDGPENGE